MGRSPGKWIKTVLFGKKSVKSNISKGDPIGKKGAAEPPAGDLGLSHPVILDTPNQSINRGDEKVESEKGSVPSEAATSLLAKQGVNSVDPAGLNSTDDGKRRRQEEAATKAQAAFRGYLARRAFRALKGIIRLQALIRGHLVRRQAVSTLRCMKSIVKLQALARGRRVRLSYPGLQLSENCRLHEVQDATQLSIVRVNTASRSDRLATNVFASKLLASLPTAMPLSLQYDLAEPISAWVWLKRWSLLCFWEPLARPKNIANSKSQGKQTSCQIVVAESGKSKRTFRKVGSAAAGDNTTLGSSEVEKSRRNPRKLVSHQNESVQEQPQNELESVKRNLRKVSASLTIVAEKSETETEKLQQNPKKSSNVTASDVSEPAIINSEKPSDLLVVVDKLAETETSSKLLVGDEHVALPHVDHPAVEQHSMENGKEDEINATGHEELSSKEDQIGKENQRTRRRRSFPAKQEYPENVSQNTPSVPSYMAATESAKAKLIQGFAKLGEEGVENDSVRRHSLPSSTNSKLTSLSPRMQKPAQANGKGGSKSNKSLSTSRDERVLLPGWRR